MTLRGWRFWTVIKHNDLEGMEVLGRWTCPVRIIDGYPQVVAPHPGVEAASSSAVARPCGRTTVRADQLTGPKWQLDVAGHCDIDFAVDDARNGGENHGHMSPVPIHRWAYVATRLMKDAVLRIPGVAQLDERRHADRTGQMFDPEWVVGLLEGHLRRLRAHGGKLEDLRALELGPGNSLGQAFLLCVLGAERCTAVDVRRYASAETGRGIYRRLLQQLEAWVEEQQLPSPLSPEARRTRAEQLLPVGMRFPTLGDRLSYEITDGRSLPLPDACVNFVYSCSVLEHVQEIETVYCELARVVSSGGLCSHIIDLRDHHHSEPLDFLRYGETLWSLMQGRSAGFTNRLRASDHLRFMEGTGFEILEVRRKEADAAPPSHALAPRFRRYSEDELRTLTIVVTARRK